MGKLNEFKEWISVIMGRTLVFIISAVVLLTVVLIVVGHYTLKDILAMSSEQLILLGTVFLIGFLGRSVWDFVWNR